MLIIKKYRHFKLIILKNIRLFNKINNHKFNKLFNLNNNLNQKKLNKMIKNGTINFNNNKHIGIHN